MRITPATHPNHPTVGRRFRAWDGKLYYCEWHDRRRGFEMVEVAPGGDNTPIVGGRRTNVSERAIDRTFHRED